MPPVDNLFFAVLPDVGAAAKIADLAKRLRRVHGLSGKPTPARRLHVTLYGLGWFAALSQEEIETARSFGNAVIAPSFAVEFNCVMSFKHPREKPFVLVGDNGVAGLVKLRNLLAASIAKKALSIPTFGGFVPHITLLRDQKSIDEHPV